MMTTPFFQLLISPLTCRIFTELALLLPFSQKATMKDRAGLHITHPRITGALGANCGDWHFWQFDCKVSEETSILFILLAVGLWIYCILYYYCSYCTRKQIRGKPYTEYRAPTILLRLQVGSLLSMHLPVCGPETNAPLILIRMP